VARREIIGGSDANELSAAARPAQISRLDSKH